MCKVWSQRLEDFYYIYGCLTNLNSTSNYISNKEQQDKRHGLTKSAWNSQNRNQNYIHSGTPNPRIFRKSFINLSKINFTTTEVKLLENSPAFNLNFKISNYIETLINETELALENILNNFFKIHKKRYPKFQINFGPTWIQLNQFIQKLKFTI